MDEEGEKKTTGFVVVGIILFGSGKEEEEKERKESEDEEKRKGVGRRRWREGRRVKEKRNGSGRLSSA